MSICTCFSWYENIFKLQDLALNKAEKRLIASS